MNIVIGLIAIVVLYKILTAYFIEIIIIGGVLGAAYWACSEKGSKILTSIAVDIMETLEKAAYTTAFLYQNHPAVPERKRMFVLAAVLALAAAISGGYYIITTPSRNLTVTNQCSDYLKRIDNVQAAFAIEQVKSWEVKNNKSDSTASMPTQVYQYLLSECSSNPDKEIGGLTNELLSTYLIPLQDGALCKDYVHKHSETQQAFIDKELLIWSSEHPDMVNQLNSYNELCKNEALSSSTARDKLFAMVDAKAVSVERDAEIKLENALQKEKDEAKFLAEQRWNAEVKYQLAKKKSDEESFNRAVQLLEAVNGGKTIKYNPLDR